jgi:hypothetical protein
MSYRVPFTTPLDYLIGGDTDNDVPDRIVDFAVTFASIRYMRRIGEDCVQQERISPAGRPPIAGSAKNGFLFTLAEFSPAVIPTVIVVAWTGLIAAEIVSFTAATSARQRWVRQRLGSWTTDRLREPGDEENAGPSRSPEREHIRAGTLSLLAVVRASLVALLVFRGRRLGVRLLSHVGSSHVTSAAGVLTFFVLVRHFGSPSLGCAPLPNTEVLKRFLDHSPPRIGSISKSVTRWPATCSRHRRNIGPAQLFGGELESSDEQK